ncbi:hypothetical protein GOEFS_045_00060 [Gordonia effusa NBRC 100432]|uniref:Ribonuclease VapC n=1 Tax=Gordonia effusa NBRC 100432 TaxID=1077974 RepID=H0QYW5_9ACTN|nr:type II toxin-antitoxin system VapC family toxin [Gordonia effusa]GAB18016.1 hypothetical protein GOEFS_045_00060 [Gordonia effusa NBRC 100432]
MIVDTSALIAVANNESSANALSRVLRSDGPFAMSAATHLETLLVSDRHPNPTVSRYVEALIRESEIVVEEFSEQQSGIARRAYQLFGKGSGHPAKLNFGDCFSYALAIDTNRPLLFVGNDFSHTDVRVAEY